MKKLLVIYFGKQARYILVNEWDLDAIKGEVRKATLAGKGYDEVKNILASKFEIEIPEVNIMLI